MGEEKDLVEGGIESRAITSYVYVSLVSHTFRLSTTHIVVVVVCWVGEIP